MNAVLQQSKSHCSTGKLTFWKKRAAEKAVRRAAERGERPPLRFYECPECGHFHLSRSHA